jgi:hypothetical protein
MSPDDWSERLAGAALAFGRSAGDPAVGASLTDRLDDARAALGEHAWQRARDEGAALDLDAALRLAHDS